LSINDYPLNLELLVNMHIGKFLEEGSKEMLIQRARSLRGSLQSRGRNWRFSIPREHPLIFKKNNLKLQIDISCELEGIDDDIKKQNILLRIWCLDKSICYRDGIDHPEIKAKLERNDWKRVILRFHFDLKESKAKQLEPIYHLQVGGINPMDDENCWLPEQIEIPRFPYPPMDIILLCEFILMNFFHDDYVKIRKKPEWKSLIRKSQVFFQKCYFERCWRCLNDTNDTLLGNLVTHTGGL